MVLTRNSVMSENFRASKRILRDIKHQQTLRPRISKPNYREKSPDEIAYYHNILKVNVKTKKSLSHNLRIRSDNSKNSYKEIHRYELRTTTHGDNNSEVNRSMDCSGTSVHNSENKSDTKRVDNIPNVSEDNVIHTPGQTINEVTTVYDEPKKTSVFGVNSCKKAFKRRLSNSFAKHSDMDTSQICFDDGRRYPARLRRRPPDMYMVNTGYKSGKKPNWHESLTSPIQNGFDTSRHRKLELYSKQSDTDSSDDLLKDEIRFENRKQRSMQRARSELNPINLSSKDLTMELFHERSLARSSLADIEPMAIDKTITFNMIGGNQSCIQALKESVILPLVYPEVFKKLSISPPRGLLFYGVPGSGKTLMARALVNECSDGGNRKIAFFMRKGADCLSKWVGESERQLRLLFDQAYRMRPSIIFFDEIDGLAPVRSARQDQIHSSIVSTLLSLIDGLDDRGEIIVIGATNRLDSIDPALRRPGRFDREFLFTLPEENVRKDILKIHTRNWQHHLPDSLVEQLASITKGYSGADLKGLVIEAGLCALRRRYPQIYKSTKKLQLNMDEIYVKEEDFKSALKAVRPSNERSGLPMHSKIPQRVRVLMDSQYSTLQEKVSVLFQMPVFTRDSVPSDTGFPNLYKLRLLVRGYEVDSIIPGLFHDIHNVNISSFDPLYLGTNNGLSVEEKLCHLFREAHKSRRSIVHLPHLDITFQTMSLGAQNLLLSLVNGTVPNPEFKLNDVLILVTMSRNTDQPWVQVDFESSQSENIWRQLGDCFTSSTVTMACPTIEQRIAYFGQLKEYVMDSARMTTCAEGSVEPHEEEVLMEVEMKPQTLTKAELDKLELEEDNVLRKFRILLRNMLACLAKERKFQVFHNPVDESEVPDYYEIVTNPMDLSTMRQKVDLYNYNTFEELKSDLDLISANALFYNPPKNSYLKDIRRHAYEFNDIAHSVYEEHFNPEFGKMVKDIHESRLKRKYYEKKKESLLKQSGEVLEFLADLNGSKYEMSSGPLLQSQMDTFRTFFGQGCAPRGKSQVRAHSDSEATSVRAGAKEVGKWKSMCDLSGGPGPSMADMKDLLQSMRVTKSLGDGMQGRGVEERMEVDDVPLIYSQVCREPSSAEARVVRGVEGLEEVLGSVARQCGAMSSIYEMEAMYWRLWSVVSSYEGKDDKTGLVEEMAAVARDEAGTEH